MLISQLTFAFLRCDVHPSTILGVVILVVCVAIWWNILKVRSDTYYTLEIG